MKQKSMQLLQISIRVTIFACLIMVMGIFMEYNLNEKVNSNQILMNDNWDISINGEAQSAHNLEEFHVGNSKRGDVLTFSHVITEAPFMQNAVSVMVRYSWLEVYLDDQLIYEKNKEAYAEGKLLGNGYVWASLPSDCVGKTLTLVFHMGENNSFTSLEDVHMVNGTQGASILMTTNIFTIFIVSSLLITGILSILGSIIMGFKDQRFKMLLHLGFFSLLSSAWQICNTRISSVFIDNFTFSGIMEYVGLYGAFISMMFFLACMMHTKKMRNTLYIIGHTLMVALLVLIGLNHHGILHFPQTVHYFQVLGLCSVFVVAVFMRKMGREKRNGAERTVFVGALLFLAFSILELIRYRYNKICLPAYQMKQGLMPIAIGVFIVFMFISFAQVLLENVAENIEKEKLYDMAYFDALTGLRNRAWCERIMRSYEKTNHPVTIMYFDLDKFKLVNDTYGHSSGDELLKDFAACLSKVFRGADCVGRMGGDEFIAILDYVPEDIVRSKISALAVAVDEVNATKKDGKIFFSVGYADNHDRPDLNIWKVYEKSDHAMYENKTKGREIKIK